MKTSKKPTFSRVGGLCLIAFGLTLASCHHDSVEPQMRTGNEAVVTTSIQADSVRVNDDQPPKDVGGGNGN